MFLTSAPRLIAIGDIHGRLDCLHALLSLIHAYRSQNAAMHTRFIFLGDYIDRGHHSAQVITELLKLSRQERCVFLQGNHEWALMGFLKGELSYASLQPWGIDETIHSYGVTLNQSESSLRIALQAAIPYAHHQFFQACQPYYTHEDYIFVHAGLRPDIPLQQQSLSDLLMIREDFLQHPVTCDRTIIHGHTIFDTPYIRNGSVGIDTGSYATGRVTALIIDGVQHHFLTTNEC